MALRKAHLRDGRLTLLSNINGISIELSSSNAVAFTDMLRYMYVILARRSAGIAREIARSTILWLDTFSIVLQLVRTLHVMYS